MIQYSTPQSKSKSIAITALNRQIGAVKDGVFSKRIRGSVHFLKRPGGIALDCASCVQACAAGAESVEVTDTETGIVYRATFETIRAHSIRIDRGFGAQLALEFRYWNTGKPVDPNVKQLALAI